MVEPRGANSLCRIRTSGDDSEVRLPFGEGPDGQMRHISEVDSGLACNCVCPGCGAPLVARKGEFRDHHFAHLGAHSCTTAPETMLHKFAKEILAHHKRLWLPAVTATFRGEPSPIRDATVFTFDDAVIEQRLEGMQPDVILRVGERRLLVEVYVTNPCSQEKRALIDAEKLPAIEINLSKAPRLASREDWTAAILRDAPREWLYNHLITKKVAAMQAEELRREEARERAAAREQAAFERRIAAIEAAVLRARETPPADTAPTNPGWEAAFARLKETGVEHAINVPIPGDEVFAVPRRYWQAALLDAYIASPIRKDATDPPFHTKDALAYLQKAGYLRRELAVFMNPETAAALRARIPDFARPYQVVARYLSFLVDAGILDPFRSRWSISGTLWHKAGEQRRRRQEEDRRARELAHKRATVRDRFDALLQALPADVRRRIDRTRWFRQALADFHGQTPEELCNPGQLYYHDLNAALARLKAMLAPGGPAEERLLGLPLESYLAARKDEQRRQKEAEEHEAAATREIVLVNEAIRTLGEVEGNRWLDSPSSALGGRSPREAARASGGGSVRAHNQLKRDLRERAETERAASLKRSCLDELERAAMMVFHKQDLVGAFMMSPYPELGNKSPRTFCKDRETLATCLGVLRQRTAKRRR